MAVTNFEIQMYVDDTESPAVYWVQTTASFSDPHITYLENGYSSVPTVVEANGNFLLEVLIREIIPPETPSNPACHEVDLGAFPFTVENDTLEIHLVDENGVSQSSGTVVSADAQQETRPWGTPSTG